MYVKLDAPDALVCCKLNIVNYHADVQPVRQGQLKKKGKDCLSAGWKLSCSPGKG